MASQPITALPLATSVDDAADLLVIAQGGVTKKIAVRDAVSDTLPRLVWDVRLNGGAAGDGVVDDRAAIAATITLATPGRGVVYVPSGTYRLTLTAHPSDGAYRVAVVLPTGVTLRGDGPGSSVLKLANAQTGQTTVFASMVMNAQLSGLSTDITIQDLTLDGNNANQTLCQHGITWIRTQRARCERVTVKNFRGVSNAGADENFYFEAELSTNLSYIGCHAICTGGLSSSGFSANGCTGVRYTDCTAAGLTVANGFTHNTCRSVMHANCWAYLCVGSGFNSEVSDDVTYASCIAGGKASAAGAGSYPHATNADLRNLGPGFNCNGTTNFLAVGCVSDGNNVAVSTGSRGKWVGGAITNNAAPNAGLTMLAASDVFEVANTMFGGNALADIYSTAGYHTTKGALPAVAVGASTVAVANPFEFPVDVYLVGGTVTAIAINGTTTGLTSGHLRVPHGGTITVTYSVAPTWTWIGS